MYIYNIYTHVALRTPTLKTGWNSQTITATPLSWRGPPLLGASPPPAGYWRNDPPGHPRLKAVFPREHDSWCIEKIRKRSLFQMVHDGPWWSMMVHDGPILYKNSSSKIKSHQSPSEFIQLVISSSIQLPLVSISSHRFPVGSRFPTKPPFPPHSPRSALQCDAAPWPNWRRSSQRPSPLAHGNAWPTAKGRCLAQSLTVGRDLPFGKLT